MARNTCEVARTLRGRGAAEEGLLARPDRPRRCTLPMTALRVIPPSSAAIWLADRPSAHNFLRFSTRSSVHDMALSIHDGIGAGRRARARQNPTSAPGSRWAGPTRRSTDGNSGNSPPHEMSYSNVTKPTICRDSRARVRWPPVRIPPGLSPANVRSAAPMPGRRGAAAAELTPCGPAIEYDLGAARRGGTFHFGFPTMRLREHRTVLDRAS